MRYRKEHLFLIIFICGLSLYLPLSRSMAEDENLSTGTVEEKTVIQEPEEPEVYFATEGDFFLGYRYVTTEDNLKTAEFSYPHSSLSFGLNLLSCPLPWRYHVNTEFISKRDFYTDAGFAYKDLVLFRNILVGVRHNLDHYENIADLENIFSSSPESGLTAQDDNPQDKYHIDFTSNILSLRLKAKDFPFHVFTKHRYVEREGRIQQRYLVGYFGNLNINSETRDIKWKSNAVKLGANSHLGPIEVEYDYDTAQFDSRHNRILYANYPEGPATAPRPADTYPHNVIPDTESSAHTIKMHSSYTGGIVASATLSSLSRKNNYSSTESETLKGAFDFSWIPDPIFGLFFKFRHTDVNLDTPDTVTLRGMSNTLNYPVRQGISFDKEIFSLSSRYKPLKRLSLFAEYKFSHLSRENTAEWELPSSQIDTHTVELKAHARPLDKVTLKALYEYKNYDKSSYNITPDNSNRFKLSTTYIPLPWLNIYLEYGLYLTDLNPLRYLINTDPVPKIMADRGERNGQQDQILASLTTTISPKLSMTFSWFYQRWDLEQDLTYALWSSTGGGAFPPYTDYGVPYTDKANSFMIGLQWLPRDDVTVAFDISHTIAEGTTGYKAIVGGTDLAFSSYSSMKSEETGINLDLTKKFARKWEVGLRSYFNIYNDRDTDRLDGNVFTTTFAIKRYF